MRRVSGTLASYGTRLGHVIAHAERDPRVRPLLLHPVVTRLGYWIASAGGLLWGALLSQGRMQKRGGVLVASGLPRWAFGRSGTTVGAVYLTRDLASDTVLKHEAVHRQQWRRYGLWFILLYLLAGQDPLTNRFEIEAGLTLGGYRRGRR